MAKKATNMKVLLTTVISLATTDKIQRTLLGEYSDGTVRSLPDALDGEILSPQDRERIFHKKRKKSKKKDLKKKKNSSKKKKTGKIDMRI